MATNARLYFETGYSSRSARKSTNTRTRAGVLAPPTKTAWIGLDIAGIKRFQDGDQPTGRDLVDDAEGAHSRDPDTRGGELTQRLAIVGLDVALTDSA